MKGMNLDANSLKMPGKGGASAAPSGPLLPSQGVFKQKAWLPWWMVPVVIALAALAVLLYMLLPKNVVVPDVVGAKSTFEAEKELTETGFKLAGAPKEKVDPDAPAGSVIGQTPAAGEKAEKGERGHRPDRGRRRQDQRPEGRRHERSPTPRPRCATRA